VKGRSADAAANVEDLHAVNSLVVSMPPVLTNVWPKMRS
jgi:hypothetical protein